MAPETHGHNIIVRVLEKNVALERKAASGPALRIEECLVGDKSGCMLLTAKNGKSSHGASENGWHLLRWSIPDTTNENVDFFFSCLGAIEWKPPPYRAM
jgi:hypothetical protein